ncbi:MAG: hypothetical protein IPN80_10045 [Flavobacterium sp.]|jgi:hypothetical protein|nr:hypothetical protein [Flavobacterium sp.]
MNSNELTPISPELEDFMKLQKFSSLAELLAIDDEDLLALDGFGWRLMKEVLGLRKIQ